MDRALRLAWLASVAGATLLAGACGGSPDDASSQDPAKTYIAFSNTFQGFRDWRGAPATSDGPVDVVHENLGPMRVYINAMPGVAAKDFPVGTVIVKETQEDDVTARRVFAMVKRGGDFNPDGARDWEWFELQNQADGTEFVRWRGVGPPAGETYGGNPNGGCNGCHVAAVNNDYVWSSAVQLGSP